MEKKMFYKKARNWVKKLVIFKFLAVLIVTFQNCAPPVENQGSYGSSGISKTAKMAYETKMDTLAYMSCSGNNIKNVFNFKLRAHSPYNSGIKFTEDYRQKTSTYKDSTLLSKLPQDPLSGAAALQMSLRSSQDFKQFDSIAKNTVGYAFGRVLSSEPIALAMHHLPNGLYANFINGMPENNLRRQLGISLLLDDVAEEKHEELRDSLRSSSSLVLSYQDGRGEETDLLQAGENFFGSEFKLNFGDSNGTSVTTAPKVASRLLSSVQERDMQSGQLKGLWKCQGPLKFVIVRPKDVDDGSRLSAASRW